MAVAVIAQRLHWTRSDILALPESEFRFYLDLCLDKKN
jgi:hypothetical protein